MSIIRRIIGSFGLPGRIYVLAGSFFMVAGWGWYHFYRRPRSVFILKELALWVAAITLFYIFTFGYRYCVRRLRVDHFWREIFPHYLAELFFMSSLFFLVFFITAEWLGIIFFLVIFGLFFWRTERALSRHENRREWLTYNRTIFLLTGFFFVVQALLQYAAYHYYILDNNIRYYDIVLFRSIAMAAFWMLGYAIAGLCQSFFRGPWRHILFIIWLILFGFSMIVWVINLGILYYSGLYFSPIALEHANLAGDLMWNIRLYLLISVAAAVMILLGFILRNFKKIKINVARHIITYFNIAIIILAVLLLFMFSSFRNTPEFVIGKSFYNYYFGKRTDHALDPALRSKLLKFGLAYQPEEFYVNTRPEIFAPTTTRYLPKRLLETRPNIILIEFESLSARLSDVYNSKYKDVMPNLKKFVSDPHSTVFRNYYNASTPSITGALSQLCSFLPPTGHNEIQEERKMQNHHLLCLPEVLKEEGGYKHAAYVTAVDKEYAHKDGIFTSMGIDKIYGTNELEKYISGEPLSWGYSDHQLFPALFKFMGEAPQPFFMTLATVDAHPPFDLAKDAVNYGDGSKPVLNMFHTTDDAFGKFWQEFVNSPFYQNTIVVAVADHAIFPGALTKDLFPEEAKTLTFYDQNFLAMYVPDSVLPREVNIYSSGIDLVPTILQMLDINIPNSFEGHSIFDDRKKYPNLLGMHEFGLYINQVGDDGRRLVDYNIPSRIECSREAAITDKFTLCDFRHFYDWKRQMFEEGRFWKH